MIGQVVGSYRILDVLGKGGMGVVYVGQHTLIDRRVAIKVLLPALSREQGIVRRFFNEAKAANAIRHPGIVEIHDFGHHDDGSAFIVMELLYGETLGDRLKRRGALAPDEALVLTRQVAGALAAAHAAGIVHRDLKPDNIFLVPDPEVPGGERIKLLDFGIAKLTDDTGWGAHDRTRTGTIMGTPTYMAPEQCRGSGEVDHRADLYALGCILYQMVCGRVPFGGAGAGEILAAHIHVPVTPPRSLAPALPAALEAIILQLLDKDPARRPRDARALILALDQLAGHTGAMTGPMPAMPSGSHAPPLLSTIAHAAVARSAPPATGRRAPRRWPVVAGTALATIAVLGGGATLWLAGSDPTAVPPADAAAGDPLTADAGRPPGPGPSPGTDARPGAPPTDAQCAAALAHVARIMVAQVGKESAPYRDLARYLDTEAEATRLTADCVSSYDAEAIACLAGAAADTDVAGCGQALAARQCQAGDHVGCVSLAWQLYTQGAYEQAAEHAMRTCDNAIRAGCTLAGTLRYYGRGSSQDLDAAFAYFERGHALGDPDAGASLADMLRHGIGGRRDAKRARGIYEAVCAAHPTHGACAMLGEMEERGEGGRSSRRAARQRYEAACQVDVARGCVLLADQGGAGADALYARARGLYELTADHAPRSAYYLAELIRRGKGGARNPRDAAARLLRACEDSEPLACLAAGDIHVSGELPHDLARSTRAYQRACQAGLARGCEGVACQRLLGDSDRPADWNERIGTCRERELLPRETRQPMRRPAARSSGADMLD